MKAWTCARTSDAGGPDQHGGPVGPHMGSICSIHDPGSGPAVSWRDQWPWPRSGQGAGARVGRDRPSAFDHRSLHLAIAQALGRTIGLLAFTYVALHLLVWAVLDVQSLERVWADILKRPYITIGMAAFVLMIPLAVTSNNRSVRGLGPTWRKLHLLTYPVALLAAIHYVWLAKGFQLEPLVYLTVILALLAYRVPTLRKKVAA